MADFDEINAVNEKYFDTDIFDIYYVENMSMAIIIYNVGINEQMFTIELVKQMADYTHTARQMGGARCVVAIGSYPLPGPEWLQKPSCVYIYVCSNLFANVWLKT